jgi:hypothetical protein
VAFTERDCVAVKLHIRIREVHGSSLGGTPTILIDFFAVFLSLSKQMSDE